jgi:hypothetical protein
MPRKLLLTAGLSGLVLSACSEIVLESPVAWWLYALLVVLFAFGFLRAAPLVSQRVGVALFAVALLAVSVLHLVVWSTRPAFLAELAKIHTGMSETEVRFIMRAYSVETYVPGPDPPAPNPHDPPPPHRTPTCDRRELDGGVWTSSDVAPGHRELIFRHACNADMGAVDFARGKAVGVRIELD